MQKTGGEKTAEHEHEGISEDYKISEDAKNGFDFKVKSNLKQYRTMEQRQSTSKLLHPIASK